MSLPHIEAAELAGKIENVLAVGAGYVTTVGALRGLSGDGEVTQNSCIVGQLSADGEASIE